MFKTTPFRVSGFLALALLQPLAAAAQGSGEVRRPYRGLFGGDPNDATSSSFSVSLNGGYDDNVLPQQNRGPIDPRFQKKGYLGGGSASLSLQHSGERIGLGLQATTSFRYFAEDGEVLSDSHGLFGTANIRPTARMAVNVGGGVSYSPMASAFLTPTGTSDELDLDGPGLLMTTGDYAVSFRPALSKQANVDVSQSLTQRLSASVGVGLNHVDYIDEDTQQRRLRLHAGGAYRVTRYSSLRVGYTRAEFGLVHNGETRRFHDVQAGWDYRRPLSLSGRRTTITVTPGWTLVEQRGELRLHAAGSVSVNHEIGRTWTAKAQYQRGVRIIDGFESEMLADSITSQVSGLATRRLQLAFSGQFVLSAQSYLSQDYRSYIGSARINYALTRNLAAFGHYTYFHYQFGETVALPDNIQGRLDRQGVRVGLTFWTPVLR